MNELLQLLAPLGIGGALAGVMFYWHRQDRAQWLEAERGRTDLLIRVVQDNTAVVAKLVTLLEHQHAEHRR